VDHTSSEGKGGADSAFIAVEREKWERDRPLRGDLQNVSRSAVLTRGEDGGVSVPCTRERQDNRVTKKKEKGDMQTDGWQRSRLQKGVLPGKEKLERGRGGKKSRGMELTYGSIEGGIS